MWPNMSCLDHSLSLEAFWSHLRGIRQSLIWILVPCSHQRPYHSSCDLPISTRWQAGRRSMWHAAYFSEFGRPTRWKLSQRRSCWQWLLMSNDCNWMCVASWCGRFYLSCRYSKECDWFWAIITDLSGTPFWPYFRFGFFFFPFWFKTW